MRAPICVVVAVSFLPISGVFAETPDVPAKKQSILIRPAGEWKNPLFENNEKPVKVISWGEAAATPAWKKNVLGTLIFDEKQDRKGAPADSIEIRGQDLLANFTKSKRDAMGRKQEPLLMRLGKAEISAAQRNEIFKRQVGDEWAALILKRILQHEAVKAGYRVALTEPRIRYVVRRILLDVYRQLAASSAKQSEAPATPASPVSGEDFSKFSNETLFSKVLEKVDAQAQPDSDGKKTRPPVVYNLDWDEPREVMGEELLQSFKLMLDADQAFKNTQKAGTLWADWDVLRIEFYPFPGMYDEYVKSVSDQLHKKKDENLLSPEILQAAWMEVLKKKLPTFPSEFLRFYNDQNRKMNVQSWTLEGAKNAEFAETVSKRLSEKGEIFMREQFTRQFEAQMGGGKKAQAALESPDLILSRVLGELRAEAKTLEAQGQLKVTLSSEELDFNAFDSLQKSNLKQRQLLSDSSVFPVARDSQDSLQGQGKITLSFRMSVDVSDKNNLTKSEQLSAETWAAIVTRIPEKRFQFEMKRILYLLFKENPYVNEIRICEESFWPCTDTSARVMTDLLIPEAVVKDAGFKSTLELLDDIRNEDRTTSMLEKVRGFDVGKMKAILQGN